MAHTSRMTCKFPGIWVVPAMALAMAAQPLFAQGAPSSLPRVGLDLTPELIYSANPNDPWNKIFYFLFSRKLQVRLSSDFAEGAPFLDGPGGQKVSIRVFERNELGDRAIDPMYPTFSVAFGSMLVLSDLAYPEFNQALRDALKGTIPRSVSARALMQSDLWGAYDALFFPFLPDDEKRLGERRKAALDLTGRLIGKIALRPDEIRALPENYSVAVRRQSLPDVFGKDSGWMEVEWFMPRQHDSQARYRKVSRVFLKPTHPPHDMSKFLNSLGDDPTNPIGLDGVALITQLLLLDSHGNPQPTRLTIEAQARLFDRSQEGKLKTTVKVCEISRKLFIQNPASGGLVAEDEGTPVYLSNGGSYGFAEGQLMPGHRPEITEPVQIKLRTRCAACHGEDLQQVNTFSIARPPNATLPTVRRLDPSATDAADFDISAKRKLQEFKNLLDYFR
jgi:hypothetical protein